MPMQLPLICQECVREGKKIAVTRVPINDDGIYDFKCSSGHHSVFLVQAYKFEVLFEAGMIALIQGDARECVMNVASSLDCSYEFPLQMLAVRGSVDWNEFDATWKRMARLAERQLGAFLFASLVHLKKSPAVLSEKLIKMRNDVIHSGMVPTLDEARDYARAVFDLLTARIAEFRAFDAAAAVKAIGHRVGGMAKKARKIAPAINPTTIAVVHMVSTFSGEPPKNFDKALEDL